MKNIEKLKKIADLIDIRVKELERLRIALQFELNGIDTDLQTFTAHDPKREEFDLPF